MPLDFPLDLTIERYYLKDVLRAIIHSILFHRSFSMTRPKDADIELLNIVYPRLDDPEIERLVEEKVAAFLRAFDPAAGGSNTGQVIIMFSERREKKSTWFVKVSDDSCWEQWIVTLTLTQAKTEKEQIESKKMVETQLLNCLSSISQKTNDHKDHIPPVTNNDTYPFPFQIIVSNSEMKWTGLIQLFLEKTGHP
ncbi:autophagy-related protein [Polychytrium aggregatum]|uniref:autophagy-related protein n=1 Tax=Polychytrium aggregatum TaxID=110093 RepID=UPI0022FE0F45|nr:autophagy-related protein [Polychytrium aggregatum]KAI9206466.1 autophagy-related protein [Polychytrium aggregatum]